MRVLSWHHHTAKLCGIKRSSLFKILSVSHCVTTVCNDGSLACGADEAQKSFQSSIGPANPGGRAAATGRRDAGGAARRRLRAGLHIGKRTGQPTALPPQQSCRALRTKQMRGLASRYDQRPENSLAALKLAAVCIQTMRHGFPGEQWTKTRTDSVWQMALAEDYQHVLNIPQSRSGQPATIPTTHLAPPSAIH